MATIGPYRLSAVDDDGGGVLGCMGGSLSLVGDQVVVVLVDGVVDVPERAMTASVSPR
jgi:hypothetical protein